MSKTTTVTRIATSRGPIPVTVGTSEKFGLGKGGTIPWGGGGGVGSPGPGTYTGVIGGLTLQILITLGATPGQDQKSKFRSPKP